MAGEGDHGNVVDAMEEAVLNWHWKTNICLSTMYSKEEEVSETRGLPRTATVHPTWEIERLAAEIIGRPLPLTSPVASRTTCTPNRKIFPWLRMEGGRGGVGGHSLGPYYDVTPTVCSPLLFFLSRRSARRASRSPSTSTRAAADARRPPSRSARTRRCGNTEQRSRLSSFLQLKSLSLCSRCFDLPMPLRT